MTTLHSSKRTIAERALWDVALKTAAQQAELAISTIGELAEWVEADRGRRFWKYGHALARHADGIDDRNEPPQAAGFQSKRYGIVTVRVTDEA